MFCSLVAVYRAISPLTLQYNFFFWENVVVEEVKPNVSILNTWSESDRHLFAKLLGQIGCQQH